MLDMNIKQFRKELTNYYKIYSPMITIKLSRATYYPKFNNLTYRMV